MSATCISVYILNEIRSKLKASWSLSFQDSGLRVIRGSNDVFAGPGFVLITPNIGAPLGSYSDRLRNACALCWLI